MSPSLHGHVEGSSRSNAFGRATRAPAHRRAVRGGEALVATRPPSLATPWCSATATASHLGGANSRGRKEWPSALSTPGLCRRARKERRRARGARRASRSARGRRGRSSQDLERCAGIGRSCRTRWSGALRCVDFRKDERPDAGGHGRSLAWGPAPASHASPRERSFVGFALEASAKGSPVAWRLSIGLVEPRLERGAPAHGTCADLIGSVVALAAMLLRWRLEWPELEGARQRQANDRRPEAARKARAESLQHGHRLTLWLEVGDITERGARRS